MSGDFGQSGMIAATVALVQVMEEIRDILSSLTSAENVQLLNGDVKTVFYLNTKSGGEG